MSTAAKTPLPELTKHQALVLQALAREANPASAYALLDQLRDEGLRAPQQVYRALDKLIEYGLVHRVESLNSFVVCAHTHAEGHDHGLVVFAICDTCGQVDEFLEPAVERRLQTWSKANGFRPSSTHVEMHGICSRCAAAPAA
ncbi:Fur family transcriptional regulator [Comamonas sp.]|uniref:Fur family transcriptional regulator n=1 Tax=Comamonas sp. TaxID=34028 RepID=UPI003D14DB84